MENQLDKLTQLGTEAVQSAITHYTHWYFVSSVCWLTLGLLCAVAAWKIWRHSPKWDISLERGPNFGPPLAWMIAAFLAIIAIITVPCNLPTLLQPRAYAIHQLITDVTP